MAAQDQSSGQQMLRDDWRGNELNLWEGHMFPKKSFKWHQSYPENLSFEQTSIKATK